jgi:myosin heavy subunit
MFNGLRRYLGASAIFHFSFILFALFASLFAKEPMTHKVKLSEMSQIEAISQDEIMHSIAVSEEELQASLNKYQQMKNNHQSSLKSSQHKVDQTNRQLSKKQSQLNQKSKELKALEAKIKRMEQRQKDLAAKSEAEAKKKRVEQRKVAEQKEKKEKLEREHKRESERQRRLQEQKEANQRALDAIAARNKKAEERELALIRGKYESEIHTLLYDAWTLPYDRQSVHCPVELTLTPSGEIQSFNFLGDCPSNYKTMIDLAVERVKRLPRVSNEIFRKKEVINFIDRIE